jgi:hypothetical protein
MGNMSKFRSGFLKIKEHADSLVISKRDIRLFQRHPVVVRKNCVNEDILVLTSEAKYHNSANILVGSQNLFGNDTKQYLVARVYKTVYRSVQVTEKSDYKVDAEAIAKVADKLVREGKITYIFTKKP